MTIGELGVLIGSVNKSLEAGSDPKKAELAKNAELDYHENQYRKLQNEDFRNTLEMRKSFAERTYRIVCSVLVFDMMVLILTGALKLYDGEQFLSDKVLITLIGSSTVSVIGLIAIVLHNLFPNKDRYNRSA